MERTKLVMNQKIIEIRENLRTYGINKNNPALAVNYMWNNKKRMV